MAAWKAAPRVARRLCYLEIWLHLSVQPYRYSAQAGPLENLVTQPYDKICLAMRRRYLALSPYNLVRVILGERYPADSETDNVYTRAAGYLNHWIAAASWRATPSRACFPISRNSPCPIPASAWCARASSRWARWKIFRRGGATATNSTLSGPKKDRLELLRATHAHCGQIFMLYPDREGAMDAFWMPPPRRLRWPKSPTNTARRTACGRSPARPGRAADARQEAAHRRRCITATRPPWHSATKTPGRPARTA